MEETAVETPVEELDFQELAIDAPVDPQAELNQMSDEMVAKLEELRKTALETGDLVGAAKATKTLKEIALVKDLEGMLPEFLCTEKVVAKAEKFLRVPASANETRQRVFRKLSRSTYTFVPMSRLQKAMEPIENSKIFEALLYTYIDSHNAPDVGYFQPLLVTRIIRREPRAMEAVRLTIERYLCRS